MPREEISFWVPGRSRPAGSKRAFGKGEKHWIVDANPKAKEWKNTVSYFAYEAFKPDKPWDAPVFLHLEFCFIRPKSHFRKNGELSAAGLAKPYPVRPPDVLKLARAVEDAMTGIVYRDDTLIVNEILSKRWAEEDGVQVRAALVQHHSVTFTSSSQTARLRLVQPGEMAGSLLE